MNAVDGVVLREQRKRAGVGLRRVASRSGWSVSAGHLSRVERGERPVTPAIVTAYEQALGMRISDAAANGGWQPEPADDPPPETFTLTIGTLAAGGRPVGSPEQLLLTARPDPSEAPARVGMVDVVHVEQAAALVRQLDLRHGGGLAWQVANDLLRWAVGLQPATMTDPVRARLHAATGALAAWAAWAAFDSGRYAVARALFTLAFDAAVQADDADLRGHILADVAAHFNYLSYPEHCLTIVRLEGDERVGAAVRSLLHGVKAHAYAARGEPEACAREIDLAEAAGVEVTPAAVPEWFGGFDPPHTEAVCGHAAAVLAEVTGRDTDRAEAHKRLTQAVDGLVPQRRGRAAVLCQARLALLHLRGGDADEAMVWARPALAAATDLRSARLNRDLAAIRQAAATHPDPALRDLLAQSR